MRMGHGAWGMAHGEDYEQCDDAQCDDAHVLNLLVIAISIGVGQASRLP